jgi:pSer/pThr/pTyr-binding forkhead associated (FHA) protein
METIVVTVNIPSLNRVVDLEVSADVPLWQLLPPMTSGLKLPHPQRAGQPLIYQLTLSRDDTQRPIGQNETLLEAGVLTGDYLTLTQTGAPAAPAMPVLRAGPTALLRTQAGQVIVLDNYGQTELRIGRYDARTGQSPEIELSDDPDGKTVSRSHARLSKRGEQWTLTAVSSSSPTYVNQQPLKPQESQVLKPKDQIRLGDVNIIFEITTL